MCVLVVVRGAGVVARGVVRGVVERVASHDGGRLLVRGVVAREVVVGVATTLSTDRGVCVVTPGGASRCVVTRCEV